MRVKVRPLLTVLPVLFLIGKCGSAHAQSCSFSMTDVNFGLMNPPTTSAAPYTDTTGTLTATCTGDAGETVYVCAKLGEGSGGSDSDARYFDGSATNILFTMYTGTDVSSDIWDDGTNYSPLSLSVSLGSGGSASGSKTVKGDLSVASNVSSGTYLSSFTGSDLQISYGYTGSSNCAGDLGTNTTANFRVMAGINNACLVSAGDLDFGEVSSLADGVVGTSQISVQCTSGLDYTVALNGGLHGTIGARKLEKTGGTETVSYNLYIGSDHANVWGDGTTGLTSAGKGKGTAESVSVFGKVDSQSTMPAAGTYTDTITVTVTY